MAEQKKKIRVLLACGESEFCKLALSKLGDMQETESVAVACDGVQALEQVRCCRPELAFIDSDLTLYDGMTVIRKIRQHDKRMGVLLLSSFTGGELGAQCEALDVSNIILKPVLPESLRELLLTWRDGRRLMRMRRRRRDLKKRVCRLLHRLCMPENIKGYYYIADGVALILENGEQSFSVTKWLYPKLASMDPQGATPGSVERDIRYAVETAWTHTELAVLEEIFGNTSAMIGDHPTNSRFLSAVATIIRNELEQDAAWEPHTFDER